MSASAKNSLPPDPHPLTAMYLQHLIHEFPCTELSPVILCIGTDRIIGDALGPIVGSILQKEAGALLPVYGTLQNTVHALNLENTLTKIKKKHPGQLIVAVDASLGAPQNIGSVFVRPCALKPGAGVHKELPQTGDIAITGIANGESCRPYLDLQTARLSTVTKMAEHIATCVLQCLE